MPAFGKTDSGRLWYQTFYEALPWGFGLGRSRLEPWHYFRIQNAKRIIQVVRVDNFLHVGCPTICSQFKVFLQDQYRKWFREITTLPNYEVSPVPKQKRRGHHWNFSKTWRHSTNQIQFVEALQWGSPGSGERAHKLPFSAWPIFLRWPIVQSSYNLTRIQSCNKSRNLFTRYIKVVNHKFKKLKTLFGLHKVRDRNRMLFSVGREFRRIAERNRSNEKCAQKIWRIQMPLWCCACH